MVGGLLQKRFGVKQRPHEAFTGFQICGDLLDVAADPADMVQGGPQGAIRSAQLLGHIGQVLNGLDNHLGCFFNFKLRHDIRYGSFFLGWDFFVGQNEWCIGRTGDD